MATVRIPLLLKEVTGGARQAEVVGDTISEIIDALDAVHPGIKSRLRDGDGLTTSITFAVDGRLAAQGLSTPVAPDSEVSLLPTFGGG